MFTAPAVLRTGAVQYMVSCPLVGVLLEIVTAEQAVSPTVTAVVTDLSLTVKPVPTICMVPPPAVVPEVGETETMLGVGIELVLELAV